MVSNGGF